MSSRYLIGLAIAVAVAILATYLVTQNRAAGPGQPAPHAIDQSP